jgi:distribution and morphology protein 31
LKDIDLNVKIPVEPAEYHWYYTRSEAHNKVQMYWNLRLNHIQITPPLYTPTLSYVNNALVQPISRYMNAHSKHIPLTFTLIVPLVCACKLLLSKYYSQDHFDGSWTPAQAMLWDAMSEAVYQSLSVAVEEQKKQTDWRKVLHYTWRFFFG